MSVSVCLSTIIYSQLHVRSSPDVSAVARSSSAWRRSDKLYVDPDYNKITTDWKLDDFWDTVYSLATVATSMDQW